MRQDAAFRKGEAISQKAIGQFLAGIVDRVVTVDAHLHRTHHLKDVFPSIEADNLSAMPAIADALRASGFDQRTFVVGPDAESQLWISELAGRLGVAHMVGQKIRRSDRSVEIAFADPALITGRPILLVDDIVSSGSTLIACAKALSAAGAVSIDAIAVHALFSPELTGAFLQSGIRSIRSAHSVPHPTNAIPLDGILVDALLNEMGTSPLPERTS
jgi:ribose-phosphate pyrophosphokinase